MPKSFVTYDLICSLGGCCAPAMQIRQRGLQHESLPFDWVFHVDDEQFKMLAEGLCSDFKGWFQKSNMVELIGDERGTSESYQYKDVMTGFRYIHDFEKPIDENGYFERVCGKYKRRFKRLLQLIEGSNNILFVSFPFVYAHEH